MKLKQITVPASALVTVFGVATFPAAAVLILPYPLLVGGLMFLERFKKTTPRKIFDFASLLLYTLFFGSRSFLHAGSANALIINRINGGIKKVLQGFDVQGMDKLPDWVSNTFLFILLIAVSGIIVGWFKNRSGDDEETMRFVNKAFAIVVKALVGDWILSLFGV